MPVHFYLHPVIYYCIYVKDQRKAHTQNKYTVGAGNAEGEAISMPEDCACNCLSQFSPELYLFISL